MTFLKTASRAAMIAALASMPYAAIAQQEQDTSEQIEQNAEEAGQAVENTAEDAAQATENAAEDAAQATENAAEEAGNEMSQEANEAEAEMSGEMAEGDDMAEEEQGTPPEGTITMQGENTVLGSELMGAVVYNGNASGEEGDERIGEIDNLIINLDGTVEGAVIGVGGFLGLGEKDVAIEMSQFEVRMTENDEPRLYLNATKEDLEAAEPFVTASEQQAQQDMQANQDTMATESTATDPAATEQPAAEQPAATEQPAEQPAEGEGSMEEQPAEGEGEQEQGSSN